MAEATQRKRSGGESGRRGERRQEILDAAQALFAEKGYRATSMRDIADAVGILGGSLYHHFESKEALYLEVHGTALGRVAESMRRATARHSDPWLRLKAAMEAHLEAQLAPRSVTMALMNDLPSASSGMPVGLRDLIVAQRDKFEIMYRELIEDIDLPPQIDKKVYRLLLLTQLNAISIWYRPGGLTPREIVEQITSIYGHPA